MKGSIEKKGNNYYAVLWINGKKKWFSGAGQSKRKAQIILNNKLAEVQSGIYQEIKKIKFKEYAKEWLELYAKSRVKKSTFKSYESIINAHLIPYFGDYLLSKVLPLMIYQYITARSKAVKPKTVLNEIIPLKEMFKHAVRWGYLKISPAEYVERPKVIKNEMQILTPQEIKSWINACDSEYRLLFLTTILTGMRRGELLGIQRGDIDWKNNQIKVTKQIQRRKFESLKTKASIRAIDIDPELTLQLKKHLLRNPHNELELVFCNANGNPIDPDNMVKRHYLPSLKKAGIKKIRFHDLRHTYVALKIAQGDDLYYISRQIGHSSIKTTFDEYGHFIKTVNTEKALRVSEMLN